MKSILFLVNILTLCFSLFSQQIISPSELVQVEPVIAINPTNTDNLISAFISIKEATPNDWEEFKIISCYSSFDRGMSWSGIENISGKGGADPVVAFDPDGVAYLLYQKRELGRLYLKKSYDGGLSWPDSIVVYQSVNEPPDRPAMVIGYNRNSNGYFDIYIGFSYPFNDVIAIKILKSTNGGESFSSTFMGFLNEFQKYHGIALGLTKEDELIASCAYWYPENPENKKIIMRIYDSLQNKISEKSYSITQIGERIGRDDPHYYVKSGNIRADSYPRLAYSFPEDKVYVTWASKDNDSDIYLVHAKKINGQWIWENSPLKVVGGIGEQWMPAISISRDGIINLLYYHTGTALSDPIETFLKYSTDDGQTFTRVALSSEFFIENRTFLGDYHGTTSWLGKNYSVWCENREGDNNSRNRQIYFKEISMPERGLNHYIKMIVDQVKKNEQRFGKINQWYQGQYRDLQVPFRDIFLIGKTEVFRSPQGFIEGTQQKFNSMNLNGSFYKAENHLKLQINNNYASLKSKFKNVNNAFVKVDLISAGNGDLDGDSIEYKDPWLIDYDDPPYGMRNQGLAAPFKKYAAPLKLTLNSNFQGVFLNQGYDENTQIWTPPYYSVRAPQQQVLHFHGENITWYFEGWVGHPDSVEFQNPDLDSTAVVFKKDGAIVRALYKGHMVSNKGNATAFNSARHIAVGSDSKYKWVYKDAGRIYFTSSSDGISWDKEIKISGDLDNCEQPAIAAGLRSGYLYVVWQRNLGNSKYQLWFTRSTNPHLSHSS